MRYVHDCYEPRQEDDSLFPEQDPDKIYCTSCEEEVEDNDFEAIKSSKGWIHEWCIKIPAFKPLHVQHHSPHEPLLLCQVGGRLIAEVREAHAEYAPLLAAAPDLLDACRRVLEELREGVGITCLTELKTAIAKAEGVQS